MWLEGEEEEGEGEAWHGWKEGGGRREREREGERGATDSTEPQNSHKRSLLSGLGQEHPLLGTPMLDFGRGILRM